MAKNKSVSLGQLMSRFGIKAKDLSDLFGVTRQTIYNNREKHLKNLTKDNQIMLSKLCSVKDVQGVIEFYNNEVAVEGKKKVKSNIAKLLKAETEIDNDRKTINIAKNVSDEYLRLLEKLLNERLVNGDDFDLLKLISKH